MSYANFLCVSCSQPINLDASLLDKSHLDEATASLVEYNNVLASKKFTNAKPNHIQDSFILLSNSKIISGSVKQDNQQGSLTNRLSTANKFFDMLSGLSEVEHPMCQECADDFTIKLEKKLSDMRKEKESYEMYFSSIKQNESHDKSEISQRDFDKLKKKEESSIALLKDLEIESNNVKKEIEKLNLELAEVDKQEDTHWYEVNKLEYELQELEEEEMAMKSKLCYASNQADILKKANVYNDAFKIWHEGPFGTINGLRLGRLSDQPVEWSEINAAMGQAILLLDVLANKLDFTFSKFKLVPMGSFSRIEKIDGDKATYELYGSGDLKGMLFWNRRFDNALVSFLHCLSQLGDFAENKDPKFRLPYRINKDRIGDASIRLQFNQDEAWTKALKYTLIDLKWILAFCCS